MLKIAICDDEKYARSFLRKLIEQQETDCEIWEYSSGKELLQSQGLSSYYEKLPQCQGPGSYYEELLQSKRLGSYHEELPQCQGLSSYYEELPQRQGQVSDMGKTPQEQNHLGVSSTQKPPGAIDILFLDISMEDMDGMTAARMLREHAREHETAVWGSLPLLIFVTGYPDYVREAFSVQAYQFLVKPVGEKEFAAVFEQATAECRMIKSRKQEEPRELLIRKGSTTRKVMEEDIYYAESSNRKVILCLGSEKITYYGKISGLEEELSDHFFRVHKGYLANMKYVERYSRTEIWMKNGDKLLISRYKYQDFAKAYLRYISGGNG